MKTPHYLTIFIALVALVFAQDPNNPDPNPCCNCGGSSNPAQNEYPQSEGSGCGETEEVGVNDDGTLNIQLDPIPPNCNWYIKITDNDGKELTLPVTHGSAALPIRVEYRCTGSSDSEPPCKVKCYTCSEESCGTGSCSDPGDGGTGKETTAQHSVYVRIPVGFRRFGDYKTYLRLHLPENSISNPGPSALEISSGNGYAHTINDNGTPADDSDDYVSSITCQFGHASVAKTPTAVDSNAYTVSLRTSPSANVHRTIVFENTGSSFRVSSTYMGKTSVTDWHPKTGASNTLTMDKGYMNGSTFEVLRSEDKIISQPDPSTYVIRFKVYERPSNAASGTLPSLLVSDREITYVKYSWSWQVVKRVIDPDGEKLTTTYTYYQSGEMTGPNSYAGVGRLKSMTSYDGREELHIYDEHTHIVYTPFKGDPDGVETINSWNNTYTEKTKTKKVQGTLVEQQVTTYNPASLTYTIKSYSSATNFLTTTFEYYPVNANAASSAKLKKIIHPDQTATLFNYSETPLSRTEEISKGEYNGSVIVQGTLQAITKGIHGALETSLTQAVGTGAGTILDHMQVADVDNFGRALETHYFPVGGVPAYTTTAAYDCCGLVASTDKYGVATNYQRDALGRTIKENSLGVTHETLFNGLTTHKLRYAQTAPLSLGSASSTNDEIARNVRNLSGSTQESWARSPQTGDMIKTSTTETIYRNPVAISSNSNPNNLAANIGKVSSQSLVQVTDDNGITPAQTQSFYIDGNPYESSGNLSANVRYGYQANANGMLNSQAYLDAGVEKEASSVQNDWLDRPLTEAKGSIQNTKVYTGARLTRSYDADGVDTFYFYNSKGEMNKTVLDLDGNNVASDSIDQVTIFESFPSSYTPVGGSATSVITSAQKVIVSGTTQVTTTIKHSTPDGLKSWSLILGTANPTYTQTTLTGNGNWTETTTHPDGTKSHQIYTAGRLAKLQKLSNEATPSIITETTYTSYDNIGRSTVVTDKRTGAAGATTTNYLNLYTDSVQSVEAAGRTTSYNYDHRGRQTLVNQPDTGSFANETITKYFPDGSTKEVTGDQTYRSTYTYDYAGRMKTLVTYGTTTATTTWNYSASTGKLLSKRDHDDKGVDYTYTNAGRLKTRTWARGKHTRYEYDPAGRMKARRYFLAKSDDTPTAVIGNDEDTGDVTYEYNRLSQSQRAVTANYSTTANGNTTVIRPGIEISRKHSASDFRNSHDTLIIDPDLASTTNNGSTSPSFLRSLHRKYDTIGRNEGYILSLSDSSTISYESEVTYIYHQNYGRLATINAHPIGTSATDHSFDYGYQADSNLVKTTQGSYAGSSGNVAIYQATRTFETTRNVLDKIENTKGSTSTVISGSDYFVNAIGQRESITRSGTAPKASASASYAYNNLGELVEANEDTNTHDRAYKYDGIGNREKTVAGSLNLNGTSAVSYTPNALNQYTAVPGLTPSPEYDFDGNATKYPLPSNSNSNADLTFDGENRLIKIVSGGSTIEFVYDAFSRRIIRKQLSNEITYFYDDWNCIGEYQLQNSSTLHTSHVWGLDLSGTFQGAGGVGGLLSTTKAGDVASYFPLYDGNGNITAYLDKNGDVEAAYSYDPFGKIVDSQNGTLFTYNFSTKPLDLSTGLYYYGYRFYDPNTGRWLNRDPIEESGELNLYGFLGNDALDSWDILGLCKKKIFYIGRDQVMNFYPGVRTECSDTYKNMIEYAQMAGFEVVENAVINVVDDAWRSGEYSHIVYYNHGEANGDIWYDLQNGGEMHRELEVVFDYTRGRSENLTICCCSSDKVVTVERINVYTVSRIKLDRIVPPYEGKVYPCDHYQRLLDFFYNLTMKSGEDYMCQ
jgi:RHS repeat-associated protein